MQHQHFCSHCSPKNKNQSFVNTAVPHHHGSSDHTHVVLHASHVTIGYRGGSSGGGYVTSSSPTKNPSLSPSHSVQNSGQGSHGHAVSSSPSLWLPTNQGHLYPLSLLTVTAHWVSLASLNHVLNSITSRQLWNLMFNVLLFAVVSCAVNYCIVKHTLLIFVLNM